MSSAIQVGVSPFPQPPEYAKQYTNENIAKKNVLPPPPIPCEFTVFGEDYNFEEDMIRSLQSQKMQQLFSSSGDWRSELKKLNRSTIAAFLDLLDILVRCPNHPERLEKINNLRLLFINMHHLINEYRPLQARDTLQLMLKQQIKSIEDVTKRFRLHLDAGREALQCYFDEIPFVSQLELKTDKSLGADITSIMKMDADHDEKLDYTQFEESLDARESNEEKKETYLRDLSFLKLLESDGFSTNSDSKAGICLCH